MPVSRLVSCHDTHDYDRADLNYRLNLSDEDVRTILRTAIHDKHAYSLLLYHDQVRISSPVVIPELTPAALAENINTQEEGFRGFPRTTHQFSPVRLTMLFSTTGI